HALPSLVPYTTLFRSIQSAARITSRLCSITSSECPALKSLRKVRSSFATSSKCNPVVGSSKRNSLPRWVVLESTVPATGLHFERSEEHTSELQSRRHL